ncbi:hypothetical protein BDZ94DRAFT_1315014 [Collybia nuda]|uniref:Uncharacterized protein n=1 Tax=Collybia nuda TaxID=64659 RepID=A0A9P5XT87_9AGAR|nr:hypothetical protein BDZ94DRAFT_1315014 [Collybia nuda]
MAPAQWATPEQNEFLVTNCNAFIEAQKTKTVYKFWVTVHRDWFERWPEPGTERLNVPGITEEEKIELGKRIDERKKKIKRWFNNHGNKTRKAKSVVLHINGKARRRPQLVEFYSQKVYETKIKQKVDEEMVEKGFEPRKRLSVVRRVTQAVFDEEPEDIKKAILAEFDAIVPPAAKKREENEVDITTKTMADTIQSLPTILDQVFEELSLRTGWTFSVISGGPDPINGGRIATLAYHRGKNGLGMSFGKAHPTFEDTILLPFAHFLKGVYPSSLCASRALEDWKKDSNVLLLLQGEENGSGLYQIGESRSQEQSMESGEEPLPTSHSSASPSLNDKSSPTSPSASHSPSRNPSPDVPADVQDAMVLPAAPDTSQALDGDTNFLPPDFVLPSGFVWPAPVKSAQRKKKSKSTKKATIQDKRALSTGRKPKAATAEKAADTVMEPTEPFSEERVAPDTVLEPTEPFPEERVAPSAVQPPMPENTPTNPALSGINERRPHRVVAPIQMVDANLAPLGVERRRIRKPVASKEVVSIVDKRRALEALANDKRKRKRVT